MNPQEAVLAYRQAQITTTNPDVQGALLYEAAVIACQKASQAAETGDFTQASQAAFRAADILAAFADLARTDTTAGQLFHAGNVLAWQQALQAGMHPRSEAAREGLALAQGWCVECLRQLRKRVDEGAAASTAAAGW